MFYYPENDNEIRLFQNFLNILDRKKTFIEICKSEGYQETQNTGQYTKTHLKNLLFKFK